MKVKFGFNRLGSNHIKGCRISVYFAPKKYFFLFYTSTFTKYLHQFIYSEHLFNKIFILLFIYLFPSMMQKREWGEWERNK